MDYITQMRNHITKWKWLGKVYICQDVCTQEGGSDQNRARPLGYRHAVRNGSEGQERGLEDHRDVVIAAVCAAV
jgi:hypothetical protein